MAYTCAVLGGGRQGTAAAYDMAKWGDAEHVLIADISADAAEKSAKRVNDLIGRPIAEPVQLDVTDHAALVAFSPRSIRSSARCPTDLVIVRVVAKGRKDGQDAQVQLIDRLDPETGFTAMERTTG